MGAFKYYKIKIIMAKTKVPSLGGEENKDATGVFSSKQMLQDNSAVGKPGDKGYESGTKIKYNERLAVEITEDTRFYRKGQIINPHKVKGEALIKQGIAKKYVAEED